MANYRYMMSADDVARELNCSKSHAYKLVKSMNEELASQGYITMAGRIPRAYWAKKMYGYELSVGQERRAVWHTKKKTQRNGQPNGLKQMPGVKRKSEESSTAQDEAPNGESRSKENPSSRFETFACGVPNQ